MLLTTDRRHRLDVAIEQMAMNSQFTDTVIRLGCLRGISTLTGFGLAVEVGDWHRFTGNTIGAYLGLVPSELSPPSSPALKARSPRPATAPLDPRQRSRSSRAVRPAVTPGSAVRGHVDC
jgi:hypothetical protein